jgi:hypothetical protein
VWHPDALRRKTNLRWTMGGFGGSIRLGPRFGPRVTGYAGDP